MKKLFTAVILLLLLVMPGCSRKQQQQRNANPPPNNSGTQQREFTLDELKKYNGQNGNPAYVAVNGVVYDVTNSQLWRNGLHNECSNSTYAGADFSDLIKKSPHGTNIMKRIPVVGNLKQ